MIYLHNVHYRHFVNMSIFKNYIKSVRAAGHHAFTTQEGMGQLGTSRNAFNCGMYKLHKQGDIVSPAKNLYIIVPPEYQAVGCIPPDELVPLLMRHWNLNYYVCLLSAALYHGASHQKPQVFQVMVSKQLKPLLCGKIKIDFVYRKSLDELPVEQRIVKTGYLDLASPELTAMDLLLYPQHVGGLNHIATVLSELIEVIIPEKLIKLMKMYPKGKSWAQRLGYILEQIEPLDIEKQKKLINSLHNYLVKQPIHFVPLATELPVKGEPRNCKWMIIENTTIESDL
jgi:predicted transcriptional regulator of viral defense system